MLSLLALGLLLSPPTTPEPLPCGRSLQAALSRFEGPGMLKLASDCVYEGDVTLNATESVALVGGVNTVIAGRLSLSGAAPISLRWLTIRAEGVGVVARSSGPLTLDEVTVQGAEGISLTQTGPVLFKNTRVLTAGTALWAEGVASLTLVGCQLDAELALVSRDAGLVRISQSTLRGTASLYSAAAVFVQGPGALELRDSRIEFLPPIDAADIAVLDLDSPGLVENNEVVGLGVGIRARQRITTGCNRFQGPSLRVTGPHESACANDLAANRLDWRARRGTPLAGQPSPP